MSADVIRVLPAILVAAKEVPKLNDLSYGIGHKTPSCGEDDCKAKASTFQDIEKHATFPITSSLQSYGAPRPFKATDFDLSIFFLELCEFGFEVPLLAGAFVVCEEFCAGRGGLIGSCRISRASRRHAEY